MIVKALVSSEEAAPGRPRPEWDTQDFRDGSGRSFVVTRLVSLDWRSERGKDIIWTAMLREKYFKACPRGLDRFDKDEFVPVRNDHRRALTTIAREAVNRRIVSCPSSVSQPANA